MSRSDKSAPPEMISGDITPIPQLPAPQIATVASDSCRAEGALAGVHTWSHQYWWRLFDYWVASRIALNDDSHPAPPQFSGVDVP